MKVMELATLADLEQWKNEIVREVTNLIKGEIPQPEKWVKSGRAKEILGCSPGTLQNYRQNGILEFSKVGGTLYYSMESIKNTLDLNKRNVV
ncbi:MAG: helix-turn-helix domain-containing protein [Bacteroidetes bacterium]|jgi:hypothetical protein|nr:helix-turn-helix domain-containing protein [Bacteroidota bacterium]